VNDKSTLLTHGLNFTQKPEGPLDRKIIGKAFETVGQDLENIEGRLLNVESRSNVTDLGSLDSANIVIGALPESPNGLVTFIDTDGLRKVGFRFNGELILLDTY